MLYATYQSLFVYRLSPPVPTQFFLTKDEIQKVSSLKRPVLQYPLATNFKTKEVKILSVGKIVSNKEMDLVIRDMLQFVSRDFVKSWYSSISDNPDFLHQIDYALHFAVNELVTRILTVDFTQLILLKLTNLITLHAKEIQNAERLVRASRLNFRDQKEFSKQVQLHYGQGKLHPAVTGSSEDTMEQEHQCLRKRVKGIIPLLLPPKDSTNSLVLVLVREILVTVVLRPLVASFSDPDYWNQTFDCGYLLEQHEQPRTLRKPSEYIPDSLDFSQEEPPTFDRFLKQISTCDTLEDAYRIRSTIIDEIQRKVGLIQGCGPDDVINGTKVSKYQHYINRLQVALTRNDKMIHKLSKKETKSEKVSFLQVLDDPSLTSYFDDYLDQVQRGHLLQFWSCTVSFQDQLCIDKVVTSVDDELDPSVMETWDWVSVAVNIRDLWNDFLRPDTKLSVHRFVRPEIMPILQDYIQNIDFKHPETIIALPGRKAVCCVLIALQDVLVSLKDVDFQPFLKSPLGVKMIQRHFGVFQPLTKFLKPRSPDRDLRSPERSSMESERGDDDLLERRKSVFEGIRRTSKSILGRMSGEEQRDEHAKMAPKLETVNDHENELLEVLDDSSFDIKGRKKKIEDKILGLIKKRPKSNEYSGSPMVPRKAKSELPLASPVLTTAVDDKKPPSLNIPNDDNEGDSIINLEMEDTNPSPVDDELMQQDQVPPMIILPKEFFELDEKLSLLQRDLNDIEKEMKKNANNEAELKQLQYAKRGIWHEIQDRTAQKQAMEQKEIENIILPKCCFVSIGPSQVVEQEGRDYAVYPIQVSRMNSEGVTSGWLVLRRYSQFLTLHQALKQKFPVIMNGLELPGKLMGLIKRKNTVLESRRVALQSYLTTLLEYAEVCQFELFRRFLCHPAIIKLLYGGEKESPQKKSFIRNVFSTMDDQLDSMFHYKKGMIEQPKSIVFAHSPNDEDSETSVTSTTEPLIDLFIELFELKGLRKQAVVIFLQQLFGDTVERRVNESLKDVLSEDKVLSSLTSIRDTYWPNGVYKPDTKTRTAEEKLKTKFEANRKIITLVPGLFGGLVGRQNARKGAVRFCTLFQNQKLNNHLMYKVLDELLAAHFPKN